MDAILSSVWESLTRTQAGVVTRGQARAYGLTDEAIEARLRGRRWQRVHRGIFATFNGPLPRLSWMWAAVLCAGPGAMVSHESAAELYGLVERPADEVHVTVPRSRRLSSRPGIVVHRSRNAARVRHPALSPPRTRIEETVIDLVQSSATLDHALGWLAKAVGARLTTAPRLARALRVRGRVRWRRELSDALRDVGAGCQSLLEVRYARRVERAHRLPGAVRQRRRGRWYDDVCYPDHGVVVELDGRLAHPAGARFRDHRRDNAAVVDGARVLRYGYADVTDRPCAVAREVAGVLAAAGWRATPRRCGPRCALPAINVESFPCPSTENSPR